MRMDIVGVAIARAEHAHANERGGRPEKRSSFHADEFLPARLFCQPECRMRSSMGNLTRSEATSLHNCEGMFLAQPSTSHRVVL